MIGFGGVWIIMRPGFDTVSLGLLAVLASAALWAGMGLCNKRLTTTESATQIVAINLVIAFVPAAVVGLLVHDFISEYLFSPLTVALALIVGGLLIFVVEALPLPMRTNDTDRLTRKQALESGGQTSR